MIAEARVPDMFPYRTVNFTVPLFESARGMISVFADVREIYWCLVRNETDYPFYNTRLQQLSFERLVLLDVHSAPGTLSSVDRSLREIYEILYDRIFDNPENSEERRVRARELSQSIINSRAPLVELLFSSQAFPNRADLLLLQTNLQSASELLVETLPRVPEERMLSDIYRGMRTISDKLSRRSR